MRSIGHKPGPPYPDRVEVIVEIPKDQFNRIYNQTVTTPADQGTMKTYFTSKDIGVARSFILNGGWVYVTRVRGGFHRVPGSRRAVRSDPDVPTVRPPQKLRGNSCGFRLRQVQAPHGSRSRRSPSMP